MKFIKCFYKRYINIIPIKTILRKPLRSPISITPTASNRLDFLISQHQNKEQVEGICLGIRLGVKKRGCSGLSYTMDYINNTIEDLKKVEKDEIVICDNNVKVFIEIKAILNIVGTTMDFIETDLKSEFVFINPLSKGSCGCGESFRI